MFAFPLGRRPKAHLFLLVSLLVGTSLSATSARAQSDTVAKTAETQPSNLEEARLHFSNGVELLQVTPPNYQDAFRQFQLAYEKSGQSWKVLGNLGLCALKLERDGEALAYYEQYLREGGDDIDPSERSAIERDLLLVKGNMAIVEVKSSLDGASVTVIRKGSSAPAQSYAIAPNGSALGLRSGELSLTAYSGEKTETWTVIVGPEEKREHAFTFAPEKPSAIAPPPIAQPAPYEQKRGPSGIRIAGYVVGGVGVLTLAAGVVTGIIAKDAESTAEQRCIDAICPEDAESAFDSAADTALIANILLVSGGVLTAGGLTMVILGSERSKGPEHARLELSPRVGAGHYGLFAHGRF